MLAGVGVRLMRELTGVEGRVEEEMLEQVQEIMERLILVVAVELLAQAEVVVLAVLG